MKKVNKIIAVCAVFALSACALAVVGCSADAGDAASAGNDAAQQAEAPATEQGNAAQSATDQGAAAQPADTEAHAQAIADAEAQGQIVVTGTLKVYSGADLVQIAGLDQEAIEGLASEDSQYAVVEFNEPTALNVASSGDMGNLHVGDALMVGVAYDEPQYGFSEGDLDAWAAYEGQTVTVALVPEETWWPSDVSLPIGQPRTDTAVLLFAE